MKLCIGVPVMNQHKLTKQFLGRLYKNTNQLDEIIIVDNGSQPHIFEYLYQFGFTKNQPIYVVRNSQNVGVIDALNQIFDKSDADIIVYTHNDVEFLEKGWDDKIREAFKKHKKAGIIGAYGAKGLGTDNIYISAYRQNQLARQIPVSNCPMDKKIHGFRNLEHEFEHVAVFDGFFMAVKKELLHKTKGFGGQGRIRFHHNYDNLICIQSLENGYENILIPLGLNHLGGRTDVGENWTAGFGKTKQQIHQEAHPPLYEYGQGKLPIFIENIYDESEKKVIGCNLYMNRKLVKTKMYEER